MYIRHNKPNGNKTAVEDDDFKRIKPNSRITCITVYKLILPSDNYDELTHPQITLFLTSFTYKLRSIKRSFKLLNRPRETNKLIPIYRRSP